MAMWDAGPALAQDTRYRVEVLVLTLLEQSEEPRERTELPDFSLATDFLTPPGAEVEPGDAPAAETPVAADVVAEVADAVEPPEDPNRVVHVEEMSGTMQEVWRRLRLSGPYRPEQYLSWEQGNQEPFPTLRLHDLKTVQVDDPWADFRIKPGVDIEGPQLPEPVFYYRLDGTVALRRSRFLHLDLDLQLREPVWDQEPGIAPSAFRVYELKQSRQVRSGRLEYFDGPVLGVLALITVIQGESEETP